MSSLYRFSLSIGEGVASNRDMFAAAATRGPGQLATNKIKYVSWTIWQTERNAVLQLFVM